MIADPASNQFAYCLEEIGDTWNSLGNQRDLNFNQLPAGRYCVCRVPTDKATGALTG